MTLSDQAATGSADREAVAIAMGWVKIVTRDDFLGTGETAYFFRHPTDSFDVLTPPDYQRDLAATLAEIERRGRRYNIGNFDAPWATVWEPVLPPDLPRNATLEGTTIANAACAALLKALENSDD